jgi:hypothetical protein
VQWVFAQTIGFIEQRFKYLIVLYEVAFSQCLCQYGFTIEVVKETAFGDCCSILKYRR